MWGLKFCTPFTPSFWRWGRSWWVHQWPRQSLFHCLKCHPLNHFEHPRPATKHKIGGVPKKNVGLTLVRRKSGYCKVSSVCGVNHIFTKIVLMSSWVPCLSHVLRTTHYISIKCRKLLGTEVRIIIFLMTMLLQSSCSLISNTLQFSKMKDRDGQLFRQWTTSGTPDNKQMLL